MEFFLMNGKTMRHRGLHAMRAGSILLFTVYQIAGMEANKVSCRKQGNWETRI
jgi:hypothetical protein